MKAAYAAAASSRAASAVAFVVATDFERRSVELGLRAPVESHAGIGAAVKCGIGCSVPGALESLTAYRCVISCGFAAGLRDDLAAGTLLLPDTVCTAGGGSLDVSAEWHERVHVALVGTRCVSEGPVVQVDGILRTPAAKRAMSCGGTMAAADMESAAIAAACSAQGVPFLALRVVLDPVGATVPRAILTATENAAEPRTGKLLRELLRYPGDWFHVAAFARDTLRARRALVGAVSRVATALVRRAGA